MGNGFDELSLLAKAFAHPTRLRILDVLAREEACVCHLTTVVAQAQAHVSQHLRVLKDAGLVADRRDGLMIYYRLSDVRSAVIVSLLKDLLRPLEPEVTFPAAPSSPVPGCPCPRCNVSTDCSGS
jgi:ArsR family transcriptional regulator